MGSGEVQASFGCDFPDASSILACDADNSMTLFELLEDQTEVTVRDSHSELSCEGENEHSFSDGFLEVAQGVQDSHSDQIGFHRIHAASRRSPARGLEIHDEIGLIATVQFVFRTQHVSQGNFAS